MMEESQYIQQYNALIGECIAYFSANSDNREFQSLTSTISNISPQFHQLFQQLIAFACLKKVITFRSQRNELNHDHQKIATDVDWFWTVFSLDKRKFYQFQPKSLEEILQIQYSTILFSIPLLFSHLAYTEDFLGLKWPDHILGKILELLKVTLDQSALEGAILGKLFESFQLQQQRGGIQQGIFYSSVDESMFIIVCCISEYVWLHLPSKNRIEKSQIWNDCIAVFSETATFSPLLKNRLQLYMKVLQNMKVLDPACGTGIFLLMIYRFFSRLYQTAFLPSKTEFPWILGMDVNPWVCFIAEYILWLAILQDTRIETIEEKKNVFSKIRLFPGNFLLAGNKTLASLLPLQLIIGNPPYIRNRDITDPLSNTTESNQNYRRQLRDSLKSLPNVNEIHNMRLDYTVYFFYHALNYLESDGILGFISSNSWMNVRYGFNFQQYLIQNTYPLYFFDNHYTSFSAAEIHTIITIIQKSEAHWIKKKFTDSHKRGVYFIQWNHPYSSLLPKIYQNFQAITPIFMLPEKNRIKSSNGISGINSLEIINIEMARCLWLSLQDLFYFETQMRTDSENKIDQEHSFDKDKGARFYSETIYNGYSWANCFFNAPLVFFQIQTLVGGIFCRLGDIATIKRGITTNCNEFFTFTRKSELEYENGWGICISSAEDLFLPFLQSPKQLQTPFFNPQTLSTRIFYTKYSKQELLRKKRHEILAYIQYGETCSIDIKRGSEKRMKVNGVIGLSSFRDRYHNDPNRWYCLSNLNEKKITSLTPRLKIIVQKIFDTTYKIGITNASVIVNNTFYEITLNSPFLDMESLIFSLLLSPFTMLSLEIYGRTNFGGGALDTATFDIKNILLLNPKILSKTIQNNIIAYGKRLWYHPFLPAVQLFLLHEYREFTEFILNQLPIKISYESLTKTIIETQNLRIYRRFA